MLCSEKADLEGVAAAKIKQLTAELEEAGSKPFNPDERIKTGFITFKTEKFQYVFCLLEIFYEYSRIFDCEIP